MQAGPAPPHANSLKRHFRRNSGESGMLSMGFSLSALRPWVTWITSASLVCLGLSITGCTSGDIAAGHGVQTPPPSSALSAGKVDDLRVVDCLLPVGYRHSGNTSST